MIIDLHSVASGFCDRLRTVTYCVAVAHARNDRVLCVQRERFNQWCTYPAFSVCRVKGFDCITAPEGHVFGKPEIVLNGPKSLPFEQHAGLYKPQDLTFSDREMHRRWKEAYTFLRPAPKVETRLRTLGVGQDTLGIHIRLTDKVNPTPSPWEIAPVELGAVMASTTRFALNYMRSHGLRKAYVASDCAEGWKRVASAIVEAGYEVADSGISFRSSSLRQTDGVDFGVDLFALSRCRDVIANGYSGVSFSAAAIAAKNVIFVGATGKPWPDTPRADPHVHPRPGP